VARRITMRSNPAATCVVAFVPHTHATLLTEVGESIKTAQSLLGHSDLGTTLNTYSHVIPDSQRRAVERVAGVLFSDVLKSGDGPARKKVN